MTASSYESIQRHGDVDCSDDYSSVTSADIDKALSDDDNDNNDNDDDKDGGGRLPATTSTTGNSGRHVAFATQELISDRGTALLFAERVCYHTSLQCSAVSTVS